MDETATIGFLGTGAIAEAMVTGLCAARDASSAGRILVSRRSAERSSRLEQRFPHTVEVVGDNHVLVDRCAIAVIAVMPDQAEAVMAGLPFRADQKILSVVAGLRIERLRKLAAPATGVFRAIPMPPVERGVGPIPLLPPDDELTALLGRMP